jgi:hypothetical protein
MGIQLLSYVQPDPCVAIISNLYKEE